MTRPFQAVPGGMHRLESLCHFSPKVCSGTQKLGTLNLRVCSGTRKLGILNLRVCSGVVEGGVFWTRKTALQVCTRRCLPVVRQSDIATEGQT